MTVFDGYALAAPEMIRRDKELSSAVVLAPIIEHLPAPPGRLADVGAGTGRDAAWLTHKGYEVTAIEPVAALRQETAATDLRWLDDQLPDLASITERFDVVLINGVWHHIRPEDRPSAMATIARILAPNGRIALSLRHGPTPADRPGFPIFTSDTILQAERAGLSALHRYDGPSVQSGNRAAGVTWTWLILARPSEHPSRA